MIAEGDAGLAERAALHAALADPHRLAIVDELAVSDRSPSELRRAVGIESNLLAHHLRVLEAAGLVERVASAGDRRRRYVRLVPERVGELHRRLTVVVGGVVFVCTANSARSQLAAALWNARSAVPAASAGTRPAPQVHPGALDAGRRRGLDLSGARPRSLGDVAVPDDGLVVTVCDLAHEELASLVAPAVLHWSIPDPAAEGTPSAFDEALRRLESRVDALAPVVVPAAAATRS